MTRLWVKRVNNSLYPDGDDALAAMELLPFDKPLQADLKQPKSQKFSRLYWSICARLASGLGKDRKWVSDALKVETERFSVFRYGARDHFVLHSTSDMEADQFKVYFEDALQIIYGRWGIDPSSIADLLLKEEAQNAR